MVRNMVRPVDSICMNLSPHFIDYKMYSLIKSNSVWNFMMVDKVLCESMNGSFSRIITWRDVKFMWRLTVYAIKDKELSFSWWMQTNIVNLPPALRLINPGNFAVPRMQYWSQLLAYCALSFSYNQANLGEWKFMLLSSWTVSIPQPMAILSMSPLSSDRVAEERDYRMSHPVQLIVEILLCCHFLG